MTKYRIEVVNIRNTPDFGKRIGDFLIDRRTQWGNPFHLGTFTREESIRCYEDYFVKNLKPKIHLLASANRLGCWCKPLACHGDVIRKYIIEYLDKIDKQQTIDGNVAWYEHKNVSWDD